MQSHVVPTTRLRTHKHTQTCMHGQPQPKLSASGLPQMETSENPQKHEAWQGPEEDVMEGHSEDSSDTMLEGNILPAGAECWDSPCYPARVSPPPFCRAQTWEG